jgi:hypothetical protein
MAREKMDWLVLTEEDAERRRSALRTLLTGFDIPVMRLDFTRRNLEWLRRNLYVQNADNPMAETAFDLVVWLIRWESRQYAR